jgi:hypothetical protein
VPDAVQGSGFAVQSAELAVLHHKSDEPVSMCILLRKTLASGYAINRSKQLEGALP